jgi:hypothetical protein
MYRFFSCGIISQEQDLQIQLKAGDVLGRHPRKTTTILLPGDEPTYAASRVCYVARSTWDQMDVAMEDRKFSRHLYRQGPCQSVGPFTEGLVDDAIDSFFYEHAPPKSATPDSNRVCFCLVPQFST